MLKNVLIVVDDIEKSIEFYRDLFGLQVILKNEGNVILSEGLVLQDADIWGKTLNETSAPAPTTITSHEIHLNVIKVALIYGLSPKADVLCGFGCFRCLDPCT